MAGLLDTIGDIYSAAYNFPDWIAQTSNKVYDYVFPGSGIPNNPYEVSSLKDFLVPVASDVVDVVTNPASIIPKILQGFHYIFLWFAEKFIWASLEGFYTLVVLSLKVAFEVLESFGIFDALANGLNYLDPGVLAILHYLTVDKLAMYCMAAMLSRFILRIVWR